MRLKKADRKIVLENGQSFMGHGFGAYTETVKEMVFDTSMVGYQELVSTPAYHEQAVVFAYPLIGNYGVADEDDEAKDPMIGGIIVRDYNDNPSNFRYTKTLAEVMEEYGIPGIEGVDTRALVEIIRSEGAQKVLFCAADLPEEKAMEKIRAWEMPRELVDRVSCKKRWLSRTAGHEYDVVVVDLGVKYSLIRCLNQRACNVTVVPYHSTAEEIMSFRPDGVIFAGGPGDPSCLNTVIDCIQTLKSQRPVYGISLGHLLVGHAYGAESYKMRVGHRGAFPVKDLRSGTVKPAAENHGYSMREESLEGTGLRATHRNVTLKDVEGMVHTVDPVMTTQFMPEGSPGPNDYRDCFDAFIHLMKTYKNA